VRALVRVSITVAAVGLFLAGALTIGTSGWAGATTPAACSHQPCSAPASSAPRITSGQAPARSAETCSSTAICGATGTSALIGSAGFWLAVVGSALALGLATLFLNVAPQWAGVLPAGRPASLLHPPQFG